MARVAIIMLLTLTVLATVSEARKKDRSKWKNKQSFFKSVSLKGDIVSAMDEKQSKPYEPQIIGKKLGGNTEEGLFKKKWRRGKHGRRNKKPKKGKFNRRNKAGKIAKHSPWSDFIRPGKECESKCRKHEICIMGPMDALPRCIHFKDLKKSMKKFRKYKKKERKTWKKFHKKSQKYFKDKDVFEIKSEGKFDDTALIRGKLEMEKEFMRKKKELVESVGRKSFPVVASEPSEAGDPKACSTSDFSQMRNRIMGWFHLLRSHNKRAMKEERKLKAMRHSVKKQMDAGDKCECMKSAMWEFSQMDEDEDDHLSNRELSALEENAMEPCIKPYITSCDLDADGFLSSSEWCCCFSNVLTPCYRKMDEIRRSGQPVTYMPRCDKEGYYMPEQCQRVDDKNFECWCVDYNGNVAEGTKTNGRAHCKTFE